MSRPNNSRARAALLLLILCLSAGIIWSRLASRAATSGPITPQLTATPGPTTTATLVADGICDPSANDCVYLPEVQRPDQPDLTVVSMVITLDTPCLAPTSRLGLRVLVANIGSAAAGPFVVEANGTQQPVVDGVDAGQSATLWFAGYVAGGPNTATADATGLIVERDETNNQLSQMLPIPTPPLPCPTPTADD